MSKFEYYVIDSAKEFDDLLKTVCNNHTWADGYSQYVLEDFLYHRDGVVIIGVDHIGMRYDLVNWEDLSKEDILGLQRVPFYNPLILTKYDSVDHPSHYNQTPIETIEIIAQATEKMDGFRAYCFGNVLKYLLRAPFKGKQEEDCLKAKWYWDRMEGGNE